MSRRIGRTTHRARRARRTGLVVAAAAVALLAGCSSTQAAGPGEGDEPAKVAPGAEPDGRTPEGTLLVADFGSDTVTFVDPDKGPIDSVEVGTAPYGLVVGEDGRAWVATAEGVAVVDTRTRERQALIPYETDSGPAATGEYRGGGMGIALAPDGEHVYVGVNVPGGNGVLETVDTRSREVTDTAPVGRRPFDVDVSRDGREVYATDHDSFDVTVVPADGEGEPRRIEVAPYGTEGGLGSWLKPHYAVVRPSDGKLLFPFEGEKLVVVDPRTGDSRVERMTANTHQHGATITEDGTLFVVGTGPIGSSDEDPSLTIRTADGEERVIPLGGPHEDVAVSPDGRTAYVSGGFTRDGYWHGITVVDVESGKTSRLTAGERPLGIAVL
ncbi:YncE family protein [Streptomyces sp. Da 82-17]|uniref:YncE family protein n=1 Tax=Streptomyces sp. Da 82-17 TaxID=3377116 RepID=UPI0038D4392F